MGGGRDAGLELHGAGLPAGGSTVLEVFGQVVEQPATGSLLASAWAGSRDCSDTVAGRTGTQCAAATAAVPVETAVLATLATVGGNLTFQTAGGSLSQLLAIDAVHSPSAAGRDRVPVRRLRLHRRGRPRGRHGVPLRRHARRGPRLLEARERHLAPARGRPAGPGGMLITLTDGGAGDADGVANGVIVDPGALAVPLPKSGPLVSTSAARSRPGAAGPR